MSVRASPFAQTYFHGCKADLKPGDLIATGFISNFGGRPQATHVYVTATLDAAIWCAELAWGESPGRIYVVEPAGALEDDPDLTDRKYPGNPSRSYRSRDPLRVLGEVTGWLGHPAEQVSAMKARVIKVAQQAVEVVEN